jgi:hypothetical protein
MATYEELLKTEIKDRGDDWEKAFLSALPQAKARVLRPEPQEGPDHWPYLLVESGTPEDDDQLINIIDWLSTRGIGLVLNPTKPAPDYVLTYGMLWNYRERGEFLTAQPNEAKPGRFEIKDGQKLFVGNPTEQYLPKYVRAIVKQFLADQGAFAPKILLVSQDNENFDLCFSIESLKSPPAHEHANIAEALSWFMPAHYTVTLMSEKIVSGFQPL